MKEMDDDKTKDNDNSKILLALLGGVAIGIAIGYFLNSDKKDVVKNLKNTASKLSDDLAEEIEKGKSVLDDLKNSIEEHFKKSTT